MISPKKIPIVQPVPPRLSKQLDGWVEQLDADVFMQGNLVRDVDFREVQTLRIDDCIVENSALSVVRFTSVELSDVRFKRIEAAGVRTHKADILRVELVDSRMTGADFAEASFVDCTLRNVKLNEAGLRFANFKRVQFDNCILSRADFSHATLEHVSFVDCELTDTDFSLAQCHGVRFDNSNLADCKGILGLKGATISDEQLIQIAPLLASELGFIISTH